MKSRVVSIGDVCIKTDHRDPRTQPDSSFRYVDIAAIDRESKRITEVALLQGRDAPSRARKEIRACDVLVSTVRPNLNAVVMVPDDLDGEIASTGFCVLRADPRQILPRFLFYRVRSSDFIAFLCERVTGANYPAVTDRIVMETPLPLPPLSEQQRIVCLLDAAEDLRRLREQADRRTADLVPALFHEIFGDPMSNPKGWPVKQLSEVGKLDRGRSRHRPRDEPSLYGGPYPFVQTGDIANANGVIRRYGQTYSEVGLAQSRLWPAGTLCITIAANIAKTAVLSFDACFPDSVVGFIPEENAVIDYVRQWFVTIESRLEEAAPQSAQKNINLAILSTLLIPIPPLSLQTKFSTRVSDVRALEAKQAESRRRLDDLFQSLLRRAFRGEL